MNRIHFRTILRLLHTNCHYLTVSLLKINSNWPMGSVALIKYRSIRKPVHLTTDLITFSRKLIQFRTILQFAYFPSILVLASFRLVEGCAKRGGGGSKEGDGATLNQTGTWVGKRWIEGERLRVISDKRARPQAE